MSNFCVLENGVQSGNYSKYLKVSGNFNYYVCVELKRKPGTTNSSISITTFGKNDRKIAIASKNSWSQATSQSQQVYPLNLTANFYQLSPRGTLHLIQISIEW
jgi:hypothetical protein